jgi:hypothetical protein
LDPSLALCVVVTGLGILIVLGRQGADGSQEEVLRQAVAAAGLTFVEVRIPPASERFWVQFGGRWYLPDGTRVPNIAGYRKVHVHRRVVIALPGGERQEVWAKLLMSWGHVAMVLFDRPLPGLRRAAPPGGAEPSGRAPTSDLLPVWVFGTVTEVGPDRVLVRLDDGRSGWMPVSRSRTPLNASPQAPYRPGQRVEVAPFADDPQRLWERTDLDPALLRALTSLFGRDPRGRQ